MVTDEVTPAVAALVSTCGPASVETLVVGDDSVISVAVLERLDELDGRAC